MKNFLFQDTLSNAQVDKSYLHGVICQYQRQYQNCHGACTNLQILMDYHFYYCHLIWDIATIAVW